MVESMIDIYGVNDDTDTPTSYTKIERFESECCLCVGCTLTSRRLHIFLAEDDAKNNFCTVKFIDLGMYLQ
jgi:hypothetical protein